MFSNHPLFRMRVSPSMRLGFQAAAGAAESALGRVVLANKPSETIEAGRRRKGEGPSGRAEMPGRPSQSGGSGGGGGRPTSSGGGYSGGSRGGKARLPAGLVIALIVIYVLFSLFSGSSDETDEDTGSQDEIFWPTDVVDEESVLANTPEVEPTAAVAALQPTSGVRGEAETWTILLYQDADDGTLEQDIFMDLNEAESVGSDINVNIVAQIDRYAGGYQGDGDWTGTRRYYLTKDNDLFHVHSKVVDDLGEVSMSDPQTLVDFATWAIQTYPADNYVLILSDHGMGWPGGLTDPKPSSVRSTDYIFARGVQGNMMFTEDIDQALGEIRRQTGIDQFELVGLDACLMSHLEVYSALAPHARYVVNSQETEPALGWAYAGFLRALEDNPGMDGAELGRQIVSTYIEEDQRILNDEARLDFLRQGSPMNWLFGGPSDVNPQQLSQQIEKSVTLTAAEMDALPALMDNLNALAFALQSEDQAVVARARTYAQAYTSVFGKDVPPSYIDLGNFAELLLEESTTAEVRSAAQAVLDQVGRVVVAEKHGGQKSGSTGISIYFPNSQLYKTSLGGAQSYTQVVNRFAVESLWDDFLAFHYTRTGFEMDSAAAAVPASGTRVAAPGAGQIEVSAVELSPSTADYDQPITIQADLSGENIGYVYLFVGYYDPSSQSILVADQDYLESPETRQVGDLYYPRWNDDEPFTLKFTWTPSVFAINDGTQDVVALLEPARYGASAAEAVYTTDGFYTAAATGESRYARLYFSNGQLQQVFGFTGMEPTGAMHELSPQTGDQVTLIQTWLESDGSGGYQTVTENGETLTFGDQAFTWKELYAAAGTYVVGFVVSDLDGTEVQSFGTVQIR